MNLDELAREAAAEVRTASRSMPVVPIETSRRRRILMTAVPAAVTIAGAWLIVALLALPSTVEPPVATDQTTPTTTTPTSESTGAGLAQVTDVQVDGEQLAGLISYSDSTLPLAGVLDGASDACCVELGPGGEILVLSSSRLLWIPEDVQVLAEWNDFEARAMVPTQVGTAVVGVAPGGDTVLRHFNDDGTVAWSTPLDVQLGDRPQLAVDAEGVIWLGQTDVLPVDAGFGPVQWVSMTSLDGDAVTARRSESQPLPDGRSIGIDGGDISLVGSDGVGTRWTLPAGLSVLSADPFFDGVLVTVADSSGSESGLLTVLSLQPGSDPLALSLERYWGPIAPGPTTLVAGGTTLAGLGLNEEGAFVSIFPIDRLAPLPPFSLERSSWISGSFDRLTDDRGQTLAWLPFISGGRNTAWDGEDGVVAIAETGVRWIRPDETLEVDIPIDEVVDVARMDDRYVIGGRQLDGSRNVLWFDLETGEEVAPPTETTTLDGEVFIVGDRVATIELPDWSSVTRDEAGGPIPPFDLPELVVIESGVEVSRTPVGTQNRPYVQIHDFDGRRLIISAMPQEPAMPPTTVWIIDLECDSCTQSVETGAPEWFDLIGVLPSEGDVVDPRLP